MIKRFFKYLKTINPKDNLYGYYCPECALSFKQTTAFVRILWDEKYKTYKKYIKCNECLLTTPACSNIEDIKNHWEYYWAKKEDEILLS